MLGNVSASAIVRVSLTLIHSPKCRIVAKARSRIDQDVGVSTKPHELQ